MSSQLNNFSVEQECEPVPLLLLCEFERHAGAPEGYQYSCFEPLTEEIGYGGTRRESQLDLMRQFSARVCN